MVAASSVDLVERRVVPPHADAERAVLAHEPLDEVVVRGARATGDHDGALDVLLHGQRGRRAPRGVGVVGLEERAGPAGEVGDGHEVVAAEAVAVGAVGTARSRCDSRRCPRCSRAPGRAADISLDSRAATLANAQHVESASWSLTGVRRPSSMRLKYEGSDARAALASAAAPTLHLDRAGHAAEAERDQRVVQRVHERGAERPRLRLRRRPGRPRRRQHGQRDERDERDQEERGDAAAGGHVRRLSGAVVVSLPLISATRGPAGILAAPVDRAPPRPLPPVHGGPHPDRGDARSAGPGFSRRDRRRSRRPPPG